MTSNPNSRRAGSVSKPLNKPPSRLRQHYRQGKRRRSPARLAASQREADEQRIWAELHAEAAAKKGQVTSFLQAKRQLTDDEIALRNAIDALQESTPLAIKQLKQVIARDLSRPQIWAEPYGVPISVTIYGNGWTHEVEFNGTNLMVTALELVYARHTGRWLFTNGKEILRIAKEHNFWIRKVSAEADRSDYDRVDREVETAIRLAARNLIHNLPAKPRFAYIEALKSYRDACVELRARLPAAHALSFLESGSKCP